MSDPLRPVCPHKVAIYLRCEHCESDYAIKQERNSYYKVLEQISMAGPYDDTRAMAHKAIHPE